ncbi:hypothetical protein L484_013008 [Morus notabilis]|uniref:VQ domain-containing protein n=1 Tax=Morus notabilis TaxID=981085 RepID=W9SJW0_9ROSA|nr:uncharacterized protein LOC21396196 [Morus notabilis]EXC12630.1 hypothetical protein L484_013008 [Morus notabilis]
MEAYSSSPSSSSKPQSSLPYYASSLHSVRKAPAKPWKKPVAPLPPTPPRVYKVDPINFRNLVQRLTAAPEFQLAATAAADNSPRRLQTLAPPPVQTTPLITVNMSRNTLAMPSEVLHRPLPAKASSSLSNVYKEFSEAFDHNNKLPQNMMIKGSETTLSSTTFLGLNLSPSSNSHNWCSFPLLSPGTLSSLEQSTVLRSS